MNWSPLVEMVPLNRRLAVWISAVSVAVGTGYSSLSPPTVKQMRYESSFCGRIFDTMFRYVVFLPHGLPRAWMKCIVFVSAFTTAEPRARRPISFDADPSYNFESAPILRWQYSNAAPVSSHITEFAE